MKSLSRYVIILRLVVSVICPGIALGLIKKTTTSLACEAVVLTTEQTR